MGYYIETETRFNKANYIVRNYGGVPADKAIAENAVNNESGEWAAIVIVDNRMFEAAGFAFNKSEWEAFHTPDDHRPKQYVLLPWDKACELTGHHPTQNA